MSKIALLFIFLFGTLFAEEEEIYVRLASEVEMIPVYLTPVQAKESTLTPEQLRRSVAELVAITPDVIVANTTTSVRALQLVTRTVPIVFPGAFDPVGGGLVESFARPGGNTTGFALFEFGIGAKWVEILRELAPRTIRIGVLYESANTGRLHLPTMESAMSPGMRFAPEGRASKLCGADFNGVGYWLQARCECVIARCIVRHSLGTRNE